MKRGPSWIEPLGIYATALLIVWGIRHDGAGMAGQAWWLIPFTWMTAASLPALWSSGNWLTRQGFFGRPSVVVKEVARLSLLVFPAFGIAYLLYFHAGLPPDSGFRVPAGWWNLVLYQFLYVGLSEELFFRGYLQQRLDELFGRPYRLFGAGWGPGLIVADFLFALGHGIAGRDITQLDVFLPGLLFGWLQAKTGAVLAPVLFHGLSNLVLFTLRGWVSP